jgi:hypothetical protein
MITFRVSTEITEERRVTLTVPSEVPTGKAELMVTVASPTSATKKRPRSSLAEWAEARAESWGSQLNSADVESFTGRRF